MKHSAYRHDDFEWALQLSDEFEAPKTFGSVETHPLYQVPIPTLYAPMMNSEADLYEQFALVLTGAGLILLCIAVLAALVWVSQ